MRVFRIFITVACLGLAAIITQAFIFIKSGEPVKITNTDKGFAVVELFTSEGCSSCPPADALVAKVQKDIGDKPVYILAYHVDYWDRLGWKDAFSNSAYSDRQKQYASWLKSAQIYTPQIIVNGRTEFVGSEESKLNNAIKASLQKAAQAELVLSDIKVNGDKASLKYHADGAVSNAALLLALVEKNATTKVQKGENSGRTLAHVQIVQHLQSISLKKDASGNQNISLPHGFNSEKWELVGFVQNTANGEIIAAAKVAFPTATSANIGK